MAGRVVVFGATSFTGRLVVAALVAAGVRPVAAGRSAERLAEVATRHGRLETAVADAGRPATVRALVEAGDVLVTTVGPFTAYGRAALDAAVDAAAHYVDSTGEPGFVREVFTGAGPRAAAAGCALLPAYGFDFVPGNLAGGLALRAAGRAAVRLDVGYFLTGSAGMSSGTSATAGLVVQQQSHVLRGGRLVLRPFGREVRAFSDGGRSREGALFGGTEPLALPRVAPQLREVRVFLGGLGAPARLVRAGSYLVPLALRVPGVPGLLGAPGRRSLQRTGAGPDEAARSRSGSLVVAVAADAGGRELATVRLRGVDPYDLTGRLMAGAAQRLAGGGVESRGALGPVDAFGLDALEAMAADAGLHRA